MTQHLAICFPYKLAMDARERDMPGLVQDVVDKGGLRQTTVIGGVPKGNRRDDNMLG